MKRTGQCKLSYAREGKKWRVIDIDRQEKEWGVIDMIQQIQKLAKGQQSKQYAKQYQQQIEEKKDKKKKNGSRMKVKGRNMIFSPEQWCSDDQHNGEPGHCPTHSGQ